MSETRTVTIAEYARMRGVSDQAIRKVIRQGIILMPTSGRIDVDQADASWASQRRSRITQDSDQGKRAAEARIVCGVTRLRLVKDKLDTTRDRFLNRVELVEQTDAEVTEFLEFLRCDTEQRGDRLAQMLGIDRERACKIVAAFMRLCIAELGDVNAEAITIAERV